MVARSQFKTLDNNNISAQENSNIPHGINAGTNRLLENTNLEILRRINAGNDI